MKGSVNVCVCVHGCLDPRGSMLDMYLTDLDDLFMDYTMISSQPFVGPMQMAFK
jgi:hypothetical protein